MNRSIVEDMPIYYAFKAQNGFKRKTRCAVRSRAPATQLPEATVQWPREGSVPWPYVALFSAKKSSESQWILRVILCRVGLPGEFTSIAGGLSLFYST